jgi:hypothetical protein
MRRIVLLHFVTAVYPETLLMAVRASRVDM